MNYNSTGAKPIVPIKWVIILTVLFALLLGGVVATKAQVVPKVSDKVLKDTTINGKVFKLYVGSRGGKYTLVTSKSGNVYKKYFKK